jgi:hypothetical protein
MTLKTPRPVRAVPADEESNTAPVEAGSDVYEHPSKKVQTVSRDAWLNSKLIKLLGIVYGIASPFIVWLVITIYGHTTELELQKLRLAHTVEKLTVIADINRKIDDINAAVSKIQIDIATLKAKANIP